MKKAFMKTVGAFVIFLFSVFVFPAFAAPSNISVKVNDQNVQFDDAFPIIQDDRTFVPFRAIFEQMNADVSWDAANKSITAVRDGITVVFHIGMHEISITENGKTQLVVIDVAPFIQNDRTYVPVRFASEAFGACVDWVQSTQTVLIVDVKKIAESYANEFTYMDDYLEYINKDELTALDGSFILNASYKTAIGSIPINVNADVNGNKNSQAVNIWGNMNVDIDSIAAAIEKNESKALNDEVKSMLNDMKSGEYEIILNRTSDVINITGDVLIPLGLGKDIWAGVNISDFTINDALDTGTYDSFISYVSAGAQNLSLKETPDSTVSIVKNYFDKAKFAFGNSVFTIEENTVRLNSVTEYGTYQMSISYDANGNVSQIILDETIKSDGKTYKKHINQSMNTYELSVSLLGSGKLDYSFAMSAKASKGTTQPTIYPNGDIIDISLS